jgi:multidrug efflux pump subunit AcrA (membrane-fusion protein)
MPGTVLRVEVEAGDAVEARQPLVILEAMKMEIPVGSPFEGTVTAVHVARGDRVAGGTLEVSPRAAPLTRLSPNRAGWAGCGPSPPASSRLAG